MPQKNHKQDVNICEYLFEFNSLCGSTTISMIGKSNYDAP